MFLVAPTGTARSPLQRVVGTLAEHIPCGPVHVVPLGPEREVAFARVRATDALHVHPDGVHLGLTALDAPPAGDGPVVHDAPLPAGDPPLVRGAAVTHEGTVRPFGLSTVFWAGPRASDSQLVLAVAGGYRPSALGVAQLCACGHAVGDESLFEEVRRITLAHRLDLASGRLIPTTDLPLRAPAEGDEALVARLLDLLPATGSVHVTLSGGVDSRTVLGLLVQRGLEPTAVTLPNVAGDLDLARRVAAEQGIDLVAASASDPPPQSPEAVHTLLNDAQLYYGGSRWSRLESLVPHDGVLFLGMMGEGLWKNTMSSLWKGPTPASRLPALVAERGLMPSVAPTIAGLRREGDRAALAATLRERRARLDAMFEARTRREHIHWTYLHSRSVRWAQAGVLDITTARPALPAADLEAWLIANRTTLWANHAHHRARTLTHRHLPRVTTPYGSTLPAVPPGGLAAVREKVSYEYLHRLQVRRKALRRAPVPSVARAVDEPPATPPGFDEYFTAPLDGLAAAGAPLVTRRGARTVADVLRFLDG